MRIHKTTASVLAATLALAGLVGCTSESYEPSPLENKKSDEARNNNAAAASPSSSDDTGQFSNKEVTDAAQAWLDASNQATETLDPEPLLALSDPSCETCEHFATYLRDIEKNGGDISGDFQEVVRGVKAPEVDGATGTVTLSVERGEWTEQLEADAQPETVEAETYDIKFDLKVEDGTWIVTDVVNLV